MSKNEKDFIELGAHAKALLQLHLEMPQKFTPTHIVERLFVVFERLDLEEPFGEREEEVLRNEEAENC